MARPRSVWRCTECGHSHARWVGRCEGCSSWNTVVEEPVAERVSRRIKAAPPSQPARRLRDVEAERLVRWTTGLPEFDLVLGGGVVPGSMTLIGGEPGIGKSTLLLQAAAQLEAGGRTVLYASGEESAEQLRMRADRLAPGACDVHALGETRLEAIIHSAGVTGAQVLVIDSIQTVHADTLEGAPGNVGQVRECAGLLMRFAKESGTAVIVVGHVTRGGGIAGPKTLEHIVDTVLYFEGESSLDYRLLRATKNRFGAIDELGIFAMTSAGLMPVDNPSALFLDIRGSGASGSAVTALMEGSRALLVETQALAAPSGYGTPQRVATGLEQKRLAVLLAILERRAGLPFGNVDVFVQATGGVRLNEPGTDLAVAAALISASRDQPTPPDSIFLGELGLGGEIRPIGNIERRLVEASRMGFSRVYASARSTIDVAGIRHHAVDDVNQLVAAIAA